MMGKPGAGTCWRAEHGEYALHGEQFPQKSLTHGQLHKMTTFARPNANHCSHQCLRCVQMKACREDNYPIVAAFVRAGYRSSCLFTSPSETFFKRLRCKPLKQDKRSREADEEHLDDQVYRLHILRAMAKCVLLKIPRLA